jgi:hypothetical protein
MFELKVNDLWFMEEGTMKLQAIDEVEKAQSEVVTAV